MQLECASLLFRGQLILANTVKFKVSAMPSITGFAFNPVNQSFYSVSANSLTWENAKIAAANTSYDGVPGYLATITSLQENQFITNRILGASNIWIGATDKYTEGVWVWDTGPEAGTQFWQGAANGTRVSGQFASWASGEPNNGNGGNQDYALTNWGSAGLWDDQGATASNRYLIEYSQTPEATFTNLRSATVTHSFPLPVIAPPTFTGILAPSTSVASSTAGKFVISNYTTSTTVRVSVVMKNASEGASFSINTTTDLTLAPGFTTWTNTREVTFTGLLDNVNAALDSLVINTSAVSGVADIEVTAVQVVEAPKGTGDGDIAFNPENGHYYQFIASKGISFTAAANAARARTYIGLTGYLVTITSKQENDFVSARIDQATNVWIAASDARIEGTWEWVEGPEKGTIFWQGVANGAPVDGQFASWASGEPNNSNNEDYAVTNWSGSKGLWNDLGGTSSSVNGYVVEFSGVSNSAPPIVSKSFRYSIGMEIEQTSSEATLRYPNENCSSLLTGETCTVTVTASSDTERVVVENCSAAGPCVVPIATNDTYRFDVEFIKVIPTTDVVRYLDEGNVEVASCTVVRTDPESHCAGYSAELAAEQTLTVERQVETSSSTQRFLLPEGFTPPAPPEERVFQVDFSVPAEPVPTPAPAIQPGFSGPEPGLVEINPVTPRPRPNPGSNPTPPQGVPGFNPSLVPPAPLIGPIAAPTNVDGGGSAQIGGQSVEVDSKASGNNSLNVNAGEVNLNFNVPGGSGGVNNSGGSPVLEVKRDKAVALEGEGMLPGSTVQVWLPGASGEKEVGRLAVGPDGSFSGDISFAAAPGGAPLPIGQQVVQLTGVDKNGNQTVINLNVNIAQPDLAPELFRGQTLTPQPGFGNFVASNAGLPEQATLTAITDQKQALVEGEGWSLSLQLSGEGSGITENSDGVFMTLVRGEAANFGGDGFMPGTIASIWLFSDPTKLGEVTIAADGSFSGVTGPLDAAIATGEHTIQIQGVGSDGYIRSANLGVVVTEPALAAAPFAFFDWIPLALLGLLLLAGAFFIIAARRRKKADGSNVIQFPQAA
jgi:hypothetical protein